MKGSIVTADSSLVALDTTYLNTLHDSTKLYIASHRDSMTVKDIKAEKTKDARQLGKILAGMDNVFAHRLKYVIFFLLPIYALYFKLLYRRRRPFYVDHLVYTLHLVTFAYCVFTVTLLFPWLFHMTLDTMREISVWIIIIYIGFSVHYIYRQVWWKLILKTVILSALIIFTTALVIMGTALFDAVYLQ
jgi:hypothetical protein